MRQSSSQPIRSLANSRVKWLRHLGERRGRQAAGAFLIEGPRAIQQALSAGRRPLQVAYSPDAARAHPAVERLIESLDPDVELVSMVDAVLRSVADTMHTQGVVAVFALPRYELPAFGESSLVLVLDRIAEPGNMGTLLRSAAGADFDAVVLSERCTDPFAPKAVRAAAGTVFALPVVAHTWEEIHSLLLGVPQRFAAEAGAALWYGEADLGRGCAILVGNEGNGLGPQAASLATQSVRIPLARGVESLNAAVAGSVLMFEARRQRSQAAGET